MGIIATVLGIEMNDIKSYYMYEREFTKEEKLVQINEKGIKNTFFIYEFKELNYYWNLILTSKTNCLFNSSVYKFILLSLLISGVFI